MRKNNLVARRNVHDTKNTLVESIMTKIRPIVESALNEKFTDDDIFSDDWYEAGGVEEHGIDGEYIGWYHVNQKTNELAFLMAKYVCKGYLSQDECEKLLGKPNGYFDYLKE